MTDSDKAWQYYGSTDPYFGVLTDSRFSSRELNPESKEAFFELGERYIDMVLNDVRRYIDPNFTPTRALDFGCGVGRLAIPLARRCESVVGLDVSEGMLREAAENARRFGLGNATFLQSDDELSALTGTFDFLNSLIVFQHVPRRRGEAMFRRMLSLLRDGGVGALQFTYGFHSETSLTRRLLVDAYSAVPTLWKIRNLVKREPWNRPMMQMNRYDLNRLFTMLQEQGCHVLHPRFTETSSFGKPFYGLILVFQKKPLDTKAHG